MASTGREHMGSQGPVTSSCSGATTAAAAPTAAGGSCTRVANAGRRCLRCNRQPLRSKDRCSTFLLPCPLPKVSVRLHLIDVISA